MQNRRHFLAHVAGLSALAIPGLSFWNSLRAAEKELKSNNKSLIVFWMGGGPSHMDLWDLKPGSENGGEFKPIKTSANGVEISEVLPTVADQMKHLSIIRALASNEGSHDRGTTLMNTGRPPSPIIEYPALGAVVSSQLTSKDLALPGFIGIGGTAQRIGPGFLGSLYSPFTVQNAGQPPQNIKAPASLGKDDAEIKERMDRRKNLFDVVENSFNDSLLPGATPATKKDVNNAAQSHETIYGKAFDLTISKLRTVFEVKDEPAKVKDAYGGEKNQFGMGCLLARKLVEAGVSAVEIDLGGWDNHANVFNAIRTGNGPRLDKGMGNLVKELVEKGLWKNTVVMWMGEFGRTPKINGGGGRDHWGRCWSVVLGGGAIKGGIAYGKTSKDGTDIEDGKASVGDLFATVFKGLGLDPATQVRDNLGRPMNIADGKPIPDLV
jgi:Protein of unknown function (DUF1501)